MVISGGSAGGATNKSGQAEGDHHQSNCIPYPPNNGRVTSSGDEINGTVQVEDIFAQHCQCNRAPHLPSNAHLWTIHNQQVSSCYSSSMHSIAAEEGEVSDLEWPPSIPPPAQPAVQLSAPPVALVTLSAMENSDPSQLQFYSPSVCNIIEHLSITAKVFLFWIVGGLNIQLRLQNSTCIGQLYRWDCQNCGDVNAGIAKDLLSGGVFLKDGVDNKGHTNNLAHPALSSLIIGFFYTSPSSVRNLFPEVFKNEVPTTIALAATTLKIALDEITARRKDVNFRRDVYSKVYLTMICLMGKCNTSEVHSAKTKALWWNIQVKDNQFPETDHIKVSCSRALETKCGHAVNPTTNEAWWDLLKDTITKYNIKQHNTYRVDEMSCQPSGGEQERVFGQQNKTPQYQQHGRSYKNITIIITICADGTALASSIIFKGSTFQVKWNQENPVNVFLGYSKKGWTDATIHITHVASSSMQGLIKSLYSAICHIPPTYIKSDAWDEYEKKTGESISKKIFLAVYGPTHLKALTPETIHAALHKTGVWPFNLDVITQDMMAPSKETSCEGSLPTAPPIPVRLLTRLLCDLSVKEDTHLSPIDKNANKSDCEMTPSASTLIAQESLQKHISKVMEKLSATQLAGLIVNKPLSSSMPSVDMLTISPDILAIKLGTKNKALLMGALWEA
ncbi:hypothetical protein BDN67DRAFT_982217 [Paxillus ammoniavirescens]|nr:hypothetical protein BDN67DRAFT_982217 [Paxillus ammoniavirescens]